MNSKNKDEQYYLFLDESGDFWEKEDDSFSGPSLVGGVLCKGNLAGEDVAGEVKDKVIQNFREKYPELGTNINFDHSTDLPGEYKAELKVSMVEAIIEAGYIPVVFQQTGTYPIVNNTTTYIMFLVDGIIKLIWDRKIKKLKVLAGGRQDIDKKTQAGVRTNRGPEYIKAEDIIKEFGKMLAFAKIRDAYALGDLAPSVSFSLGNDKKDRRLILCDYVCNAYYTQSSFHRELKKRFSAFLSQSDGIVSDRYYQHYQITEVPEAEKLKRYIDDRNYGEALFLAVATESTDEEVVRAKSKLVKQLCNIHGNEKKFLLEILYSKINKLIQIERELEEALKIIDAAIELLNKDGIWYQSEDKLKNEFYANIYLFKMAVLTHMGNTKGFRNIADKCFACVKNTKDANLYFMFQNRQVVNLQDLFQYEESLRIGQELLTVMEHYTAAEKEIAEKYHYSLETCAAQLPRVNGSMAQTCYFMQNKKPQYAEEARKFSDAALRGFAGNESEVRRTYQIRTHIEAEAGDYKEAVACLEKGIDVSFADLKKKAGHFGDFDWYHISKLLERMLFSGDAEAKTLAEKAFNDVSAAFRQYYSEEKDKPETVHPQFISFAMMGACFLAGNKASDRDNGFNMMLSAAEIACRQNSLTFTAHGIIIYARLLSLCRKGEREKQVKEIYQTLKRELHSYITNESYSGANERFADREKKLPPELPSPEVFKELSRELLM